METITKNNNTLSTKIVQVTPDDLRRIANEMETQALKVTLPGESIMSSLTASIQFLYIPETKNQNIQRNN